MVTAAMKLKDSSSLEEKHNLGSILKSRDITLPTKVHIIRAMVVSAVFYGCVRRRLSAEELTLSNCGVGEDS